jgi:HD-GYP domain-containing protein (c-di-GMP phosphodiesterase class II)
MRTPSDEVVRRLARVVEIRDPDTGGHAGRIGPLVRRLAALAGLSAERCDVICTASVLHDIGKVAVPDSVLHKPGPLTPRERRLMEGHTVIGCRLLDGSGTELLQTAAEIALSHHEHFDGNGYPEGLTGDDIPLEARIVALVDVYDALTSDRCYRPAYSEDEALEIMRADRGLRFDPALYDLFERALEEERIERV